MLEFISNLRCDSDSHRGNALAHFSVVFLTIYPHQTQMRRKTEVKDCAAWSLTLLTLTVRPFLHARAPAQSRAH